MAARGSAALLFLEEEHCEQDGHKAAAHGKGVLLKAFIFRRRGGSVVLRLVIFALGRGLLGLGGSLLRLLGGGARLLLFGLLRLFFFKLGDAFGHAGVGARSVAAAGDGGHAAAGIGALGLELVGLLLLQRGELLVKVLDGAVGHAQAGDGVGALEGSIGLLGIAGRDEAGGGHERLVLGGDLGQVEGAELGGFINDRLGGVLQGLEVILVNAFPAQVVLGALPGFELVHFGLDGVLGAGLDGVGIDHLAHAVLAAFVEFWLGGDHAVELLLIGLQDGERLGHGLDVLEGVGEALVGVLHLLPFEERLALLALGREVVHVTAHAVGVDGVPVTLDHVSGDPFAFHFEGAADDLFLFVLEGLDDVFHLLGLGGAGILGDEGTHRVLDDRLVLVGG